VARLTPLGHPTINLDGRYRTTSRPPTTRLRPLRTDLLRILYRSSSQAYLDGSDDPDRAEDGTFLVDDDFLVLVNSWWEPLEFVLPDTRSQARWRVEMDSYDPASQAGTAAADRGAGDRVTVGPRSIVVLKSPVARTA
jgi:pullulanase/glycogen debranching enzyme